MIKQVVEMDRERQRSGRTDGLIDEEMDRERQRSGRTDGLIDEEILIDPKDKLISSQPPHSAPPLCLVGRSWS